MQWPRPSSSEARSGSPPFAGWIWRLALTALLLLPVPTSGQESILALEFSFSNPGARSLGLGGAFTGLADDATAAFANPAGLVQLSRPEVSVEGRLWSFSTPYTEGGRLSGEPTGYGLDVSEGLRTAESKENTSGLSFLSFVYPRGRWSLAFYRHELANFEYSSSTQGLFADDVIRFEDQRTGLDFEIVSYGVAAGVRITDTFSLGLGVALHEGTVSSDTGTYAFDAPTFEAFFGRNSFLPERLIVSEVLELDDEDWRANVGFLWRFAPGLRLGGFYRSGPTFLLQGVAVSGPLLDLPPGTVLADSEDVVGIPDVFGAGLAYRTPEGRWTVAFEWDRVQYSELLEGLRRRTAAAGVELPIEVEDGDEWHVGAEYAFLGSRPIVAPRFGLWWDPNHSLEATGRDQPLENALRLPGDDELHVALGVGVAFERMQVDLAADLSERLDTYSLSVIYSF